MSGLFNRIFAIFLIFLSGTIFGILIGTINFDANIPTGHSIVEGAMETASLLNPLGVAPERNSPQDRIKDWQIEVYQNRVVINIDDAQWAAFADTNSMDPVLDKGANAIQIVPKSEDDIKVGDIVSY